MVKIVAGGSSITLINTFEVEAERCDELIAVLVEATDNVMRDLDGFISASFHKSLDATRVVNYAQWRSQQAFDAMRENDEARVHMQKAAGIARNFSPVLYTVVHTDERT